MRKAKIYDTSLRDGAQTEGISYSVQDKLRIAEKLDDLGVGYIEGGWPGSNPKDEEFFAEARKLKLKHSLLAAFGSTRYATTPGKDPNLQALLKAETPVVTIFGKSWSLHVQDVLRVSLQNNLARIEDSVAYLKKHGRFVVYDAEHFFDGYKDNPEYALKTLLAAQAGGADVITFCDTNGGTMPAELVAIIKAVKPHLTVAMGIHTHNDCELAVANSIAAVDAGCEQVQGTFNGYGERCGNANLSSIVPILQLKKGISCLPAKKMQQLSDTAYFIAEVSNMALHANQPFIGGSAFAHKGGIHVNAVMKNPKTYEHIDPQEVGNQRKILISELSGRSSLVIKAKDLGLALTKDTPEAKELLKVLQKREHEGYHYEASQGSLELFLRRKLHHFEPFFELEGFRATSENREDQHTSEATIKLRVDGKLAHTAAEGDGPVNALDNAIRKALIPFYPNLNDMHLVDFKVRVLEEKAGTAAKVRVLIRSQDEHDSWGTIGVSENIIEASWNALVDSIEYKLLKDKNSAGKRAVKKKTTKKKTAKRK